MDDVLTTWNVLLAFCAGIVCISGGLSVFAKLMHPFKKLRVRAEEHDRKIEQHDAEIKKLQDRYTAANETDKIICKSLLVLLNHEITGNGIDKLKEQRDVLEQFLIDK